MAENDIHSIGEVIAKMSKSARQLAQSEIALVRAEMKDSIANVGRHSIQVGMYGVLLSMSVLPFIAFLIIGLGGVLGGNYWLSSLIFAVLFGVVGGGMAYRAYSKIKHQDFTLPHTRSSFQHSAEVMAGKSAEPQGAKVVSIHEVVKRKIS